MVVLMVVLSHARCSERSADDGKCRSNAHSFDARAADLLHIDKWCKNTCLNVQTLNLPHADVNEPREGHSMLLRLQSERNNCGALFYVHPQVT